MTDNVAQAARVILRPTTSKLRPFAALGIGSGAVFIGTAITVAMASMCRAIYADLDPLEFHEGHWVPKKHRDTFTA